MQRPPQTGVDPQSQRGQKEGTTAVGLLCAGQRFGKKNENGLSNSQKRVGIDRQLCCNGLIIRYDYQLRQNIKSRIYDCTQTDNNKWYTPVDQRGRDTQDSLYQSFRQYTKRGT